MLVHRNRGRGLVARDHLERADLDVQLLRAVVRQRAVNPDAVMAAQPRKGGGNFRSRRNQRHFDEIEEVVAVAVREDVLIELSKRAVDIAFDRPTRLQRTLHLRPAARRTQPVSAATAATNYRARWTQHAAILSTEHCAMRIPRPTEDGAARSAAGCPSR